MEYTGTNKRAADLCPGEFITLTGYASDAAEIEDIRVIGSMVVVFLANDAAGSLEPDKLMRLYH